MSGLAFQFGILDLQGKNDGAGLSVCCRLYFRGFLVEVKIASKTTSMKSKVADESVRPTRSGTGWRGL